VPSVEQQPDFLAEQSQTPQATAALVSSFCDYQVVVTPKYLFLGSKSWAYARMNLWKHIIILLKNSKIDGYLG
jgi:hypothetical protein